MKKVILFAIASIVVCSASAQFGSIASKARSAAKQTSGPNICNVPFHCDFWSYKEYHIASQQYNPGDLEPFLGGDDEQARVAAAILHLRAQLDSIKKYIQTQQGRYSLNTEYLDILENTELFFNDKNYKDEYDTYHRILDDIHVDSTAAAETADTITEFDKKYATYYSVQQRIERIKQHKWQRKSDSVNAVKEQNRIVLQKKADEEQKQYLTKKYGAPIAKKLLAGTLWLGMSDTMVEDEYGSPDDTHESVSASLYIQSWTYNDPLMILIFKNHKLVQITD